MTGTLASKGQLHTLLRASHFLQEQIPMKTMLCYKLATASPEQIQFWKFSSRPQESRGKTGTRPLPPWVEMFKATSWENQR